MTTPVRRVRVAATVCSILACLAAADLKTNDLRADDRDGNVPRFLTGRQTSPGDAVHPPDHWSATDNIAWKTDIVGLGWSSPIVWNGRVYLTTCINTSKDRKPRKGLYLEDVDATKYPRDKSVHLWKTLCLDLATGKIVWEQTASEGVPAKPHHIKNTLASETPTTDGERLYVLFGNLGLFCYSLDGRPLWTVPIPPRETRYGWGTAMSPVVFGDRVYYADDNEESASLVALDKRTGKEILARHTTRENELFHAVHLGDPQSHRTGNLGDQLGHVVRSVGQRAVEDQRQIDPGDPHSLRPRRPALCDLGTRPLGQAPHLRHPSRRPRRSLASRR